MRDLGTLGPSASFGFPRMTATLVNERGDIAGSGRKAGCASETAPGCGTPLTDWLYERPVVWRNETMTVLVGSCSSRDETPTGSARPIGSRGQIVGSYTIRSQGVEESRAVLRENGQRIDLPPLESGASSAALAIVDHDTNADQLPAELLDQVAHGRCKCMGGC